MIKEIFERTKESIRDFKFNPIDNLGYLIPVLIGLITFVSGAVAYVKFIVGGGYVRQVNATKEFGLFDGYDDKFTSGTTGLITEGVIGKIILILVCVEFLLMMINYFRSSGKAKRIIMIVDLVIMGVQIALTTTVFWMAIGNLVISQKAAYEALKPFKGVPINPKAILITYVVLTLVSLITFLILVIITKECRWMIGYSAIALVVAYIGIPLVFLFLQNVIPLATGAVALIIMLGVIYGVFKVILTNGSDGGSYSGEAAALIDSGNSYSSSSSSSWSFENNSNKEIMGNQSERVEKKRPKDKLVIEDTCAYVPCFNKGFKLWKIHGVMHDYIASDNGIINKEICGLEAFERGRFRIFESETGYEIKSGQIPWMN